MSASAVATRLVSRVRTVRVQTRMGNIFTLDAVARVTTDTHSTTVTRHEHSAPMRDAQGAEVVSVWEDVTILHHDELKSITLVFDTPHHEYGSTT